MYKKEDGDIKQIYGTYDFAGSDFIFTPEGTGYLRTDLREVCLSSHNGKRSFNCASTPISGLPKAKMVVSGSDDSRTLAKEQFGSFARDIIDSLSDNTFRTLIEKMPNSDKASINQALTDCKIDYFLENDYQIKVLYQGAISKIVTKKDDLPKDGNPIIMKGNSFFKEISPSQSPLPAGYFKIIDFFAPKEEKTRAKSVPPTGKAGN